MRSKDIKLLHLSCWTNCVFIIIVNYLSTLSRAPGRKSLSAGRNSVWKTNLFAYVHGELRTSSCKPKKLPISEDLYGEAAKFQVDSFEVKIFLCESEVGALNTEKEVGSISKCCVTQNIVFTPLVKIEIKRVACLRYSGRHGTVTRCALPGYRLQMSEHHLCLVLCNMLPIHIIHMHFLSTKPTSMFVHLLVGMQLCVRRKNDYS